MGLKIRGRNQFELFLNVFWAVGWFFIVIYFGGLLEAFLPEGLVFFLCVLLYCSSFLIHSQIMAIYFTLKFNSSKNLKLTVKEYKYIEKNLVLIPIDEKFEKLSPEVRQALLIYWAYSNAKKKEKKDFIDNAINVLKENNISICEDIK